MYIWRKGKLELIMKNLPSNYWSSSLPDCAFSRTWNWDWKFLSGPGVVGSSSSFIGSSSGPFHFPGAECGSTASVPFRARSRASQGDQKHQHQRYDTNGPFSPLFFNRRVIAVWSDSIYESYFTISVSKYWDFFSQFVWALTALEDRGGY